MPSSLLNPTRHYVKAYHHHDHLLLQFIWSELLLAHHAITQAKTALDMLQINNSQEVLDLLVTHITRLSGSAQEYMRLFSGDDDGIFNKLRNYCVLFSLQNPDQKTCLSMVQEANKAWLLAVQTLAMIRMSSHEGNNAQGIAKAPAYINKMQRCLERLVRLNSNMSLKYQNNENVIFFLVRNHREIDAMYSQGYTLKLLRKMVGKNRNKIQQFLVKKYTERGFEHLLPLIQTSVEQLASS